MLKPFMAALVSVAASLALPASANINGSVDTSWGALEAGRVRVAFDLGADNYDYPLATQVLADGRLAAVGIAAVTPTANQIAVAIRKADGTADTSIAPNGRYAIPVTGVVSSIDTAAAIAADGSFYVIGRAPNLLQLRVWHYALDGTVLSAPLDIGAASTRYFASTAYIDFAGRLLIGGYLEPSTATGESTADGFLVRLAAGGASVDSLFGLRTIVFDSGRRDDVFAITGVGENYAVCGRVGNLAQSASLGFGIALVQRSGALLPTFNGNGLVVDQLALNGNAAESACNGITTVRTNNQTRIVITGRAYVTGQFTRSYLFAVGLDGQYVPGTPSFINFGFAGNGIGGFPNIYAAPGDDKIYLASSGQLDVSGKYSVVVARMDSLGNYDASWGDSSTGTRVTMTAPAIGGTQRDLLNQNLSYRAGRLYLGASILLDAGDSDFALVRFTGDTIFKAGMN
ncbi:MAG: hypothetical protein JNN30_15185 [Rhodanobacteraceae bacterium]|nr:hypothetical protein [Rhodanobacteraceae bacterium]